MTTVGCRVGLWGWPAGLAFGPLPALHYRMGRVWAKVRGRLLAKCGLVGKLVGKSAPLLMKLPTNHVRNMFITCAFGLSTLRRAMVSYVL